ncbi:MAG: 30S ribosomal protein S12 methylthiotransferase RimO [Clostridia bacterium]|nr:30S ribosomal protein S12 methylthiotransferase RimO [Clostridia bacterium]MBR6479777.1 30S ribosomal protein S12 methylthiotransferase RimO [Clostridia bacterium]
MAKVGMVSLGCPKNQVDTELMLAKLQEAGHEICGEVYGCDAVIINTCAFIEDAKREAIDNILEMADYKEAGEIKKIIVTGCLAERYREEILEEIPEIDAVAGLGNNGNIVDILEQVLSSDEPVVAIGEKSDLPLCGQRLLTTPEYWAYLKIADGCSNKCTYCAIPNIRGPQRSRTVEDCVEEAQALADSGVKELIVIAQDTTRYGEDLYGEPRLAQLLTELCKVEGLQMIRVLYCYPERLTDEVLDVMAREEKICNYIDLPIQHCNGEILKKMNRSGDRESLTKLINHIREKLPDVCIRTTLITGFPGETEEQFEELAGFVKEMKFDCLGCFAYSAEEGTPAAKLPEPVDDAVKVHRGELIMDSQYVIVLEHNKNMTGKKLKVIVDGYDPYTDIYEGRSYREAPEIDGKINFVSDKSLTPGSFVEVTITDFNEYDLIGEA